MKRAGSIGTDLYSGYIELDALKPLTKIRARFVAHHKYQIYKKFPVDFTEDMHWMNERKHSFKMDYTLGKNMDIVH